jgi:hypothetical protein
MKGKKADLSGQTFGRLTVLSIAGVDKYHNTLSLCRCVCGNEKVTQNCSLLKGSTQSCGCLRIPTRKVPSGRPVGRPSIQPDIKEQVKLLANNGWSLRRISHELEQVGIKVSYCSVRNILK